MIETTLTLVLGAMNAEADCLDAFVEEQKHLGERVRERDWSGLEDVLSRLEVLSRAVAEAEASRREAWTRLAAGVGMDAEDSAGAVGLRISEPGRSALADVRRRLRVSAMRSRVENDALSAWTDASSGLLSGLLEELYPERRGRIYGRHGRAMASAERPVLLDAAY